MKCTAILVLQKLSKKGVNFDCIVCYQLCEYFIQIIYICTFNFPKSINCSNKYLVTCWSLIPKFLRTTGKILAETFQIILWVKNSAAIEIRYLLCTPFNPSEGSFRTNCVYQHFLHRDKINMIVWIPMQNMVLQVNI